MQKLKKYKYIGQTNVNIKHGNTYYIRFYEDIVFDRKVVFVYDNKSSCIGAVEYFQEEWSLS